MVENVSLYVHVPFCDRKCDYCHFYVIPNQERYKPQLLEGLRSEWEQIVALQLKGKHVETLYFGGGTPALFGPSPIGQVVSWLEHPPKEITLEVNPENVTQELMEAYVDVGINRISMGVQALDDRLLHTLGRQHGASKAKAAAEVIARAGIENLSIDLMYDLPHQTLDLWEYTLKGALELPITHLSLYNLTIEPHTVFYKYREKLAKALPDEGVSLAMIELAQKLLPEGGLRQYEISAFAKEGYKSNHNVGYWTDRPFLGMGPSAFSYWNGKRFRNIANLNRYCQKVASGTSPIDYEEELAPEEKERERLVLNLRLLSGCDLKSFSLKEETLREIELLKSHGLLTQTDSNLALTQKGLLFYDEIATTLI